MTEKELIEEHVRYFSKIKGGKSSLDCFILWAKGDHIQRKAAAQIWPTLDKKFKYTVRLFLDEKKSDMGG